MCDDIDQFCAAVAHAQIRCDVSFCLRIAFAKRDQHAERQRFSLSRCTLHANDRPLPNIRTLFGSQLSEVPGTA